MHFSDIQCDIVTIELNFDNWFQILERHAEKNAYASKNDTMREKS